MLAEKSKILKLHPFLTGQNYNLTAVTLLAVLAQQGHQRRELLQDFILKIGDPGGDGRELDW